MEVVVCGVGEAAGASTGISVASSAAVSVASKGSVVGVGGAWTETFVSAGTAVSAVAGGGVAVLRADLGRAIRASAVHPTDKEIRVTAPRRLKNVTSVWNFIKVGGV